MNLLTYFAMENHLCVAFNCSGRRRDYRLSNTFHNTKHASLPSQV